ncbi:MAG: response regulator [Candidatus Omnitrophica bacterium]|nr:response regulator [Candidatus Omnitrophota bacterium]MBU1871954.1 response regulator [Candidatus Omnitrophota bacterium]
MKKILIVDDDRDILDITKKILTRENFQVLTAATGEMAVDICQTDQPDLVLLDIAIPDIDGYAACEKIRKNNKTRDIPVLFLTGKELLPQGIDKHCHELNAAGYISKPFEIKELLEKIREILGPNE